MNFDVTEREYPLLVTHVKTGNIYNVLREDIIDTTNVRGGDEKVVLYQNIGGDLFVRERQEFWEKFRSAAEK